MAGALLSVSVILRWQVRPLNGVMRYLIFCVWLISFTVMAPRFIQVRSRCPNFLPFEGRQISQSMYKPHFVYPCVRRWTLGYFHLRALVNRAAGNIVCKRPFASVRVPVFSSPGASAHEWNCWVIRDSRLSFLRNCQCFAQCEPQGFHAFP